MSSLFKRHSFYLCQQLERMREHEHIMIPVHPHILKHIARIWIDKGRPGYFRALPLVPRDDPYLYNYISQRKLIEY